MPSSSPSDEAATVRLAYQAVLNREPDEQGLHTYRSELEGGKDLVWLLRVLMESDECRALHLPRPLIEPAHMLSHEPPMPVDTQCSDAELQALWDHVARTWSRLGEAQPHWSVLTQEQFRTEALGETELADFYGSGHSEVVRLNAWLRRAGLGVPPGAVCAEFGCGVGRITHALARQYGRVKAFDVSAPHLRLAEARLRDEGIGSVELIQVTGKESLAELDGIDVFYSIIALQHSPPPIILDVLRHAFGALRPGGYAFFQVPTFSTGYGYAAAEHLRQLQAGINAQGSGRDEMEVHCVPQHAILALAHRAGLRTVEILPDTSVGDLDRCISSTFLLARD